MSPVYSRSDVQHVVGPTQILLLSCNVVPGTKSSSKSIELKRDNSDTDRSESLSDLCISPEVPVESPYADNNLYSCLKVDSPNLSGSEISSDTENLCDGAAAQPDPVSPSINFQSFMETWKKCSSEEITMMWRQAFAELPS